MSRRRGYVAGLLEPEAIREAIETRGSGASDYITYEAAVGGATHAYQNWIREPKIFKTDAGVITLAASSQLNMDLRHSLLVHILNHIGEHYPTVSLGRHHLRVSDRLVPEGGASFCGGTHERYETCHHKRHLVTIDLNLGLSKTSTSRYYGPTLKILLEIYRSLEPGDPGWHVLRLRAFRRLESSPARETVKDPMVLSVPRAMTDVFGISGLEIADAVRRLIDSAAAGHPVSFY